jgi:predicted DNA-binding transcriptional regulator AlpA
MRVDAKTELVVAADIAARLGLSRARVSVVVSGPGFPRPLGRLGRSNVWRWSSVECWARETGRLHSAK